MYEETKRAVIKALKVGEILFSMKKEDFNRLISATSKIIPPSKTEIEEFEGLSFEDAMVFLLKERYVSSAISNGFTEEQGLAMLEYACLLNEIEE